ncbi:MAG TPA: ethanolamine utilization protein EutQ [Alphaproteobacteria bacterium]|nr:ethanolamine utilization protein EutQ [Alphaproteobacteria bacterium]
MSGIKLIKPNARKFEPIEGIEGHIEIGRDVGTDISRSLSAGVATFENCAMEWTVKYDEYFYCLEGTLTIETKKGDFILTPGTGIWLPEGTWLVYRAKERARVVFSVYPADWRERLEKKA